MAIFGPGFFFLPLMLVPYYQSFFLELVPRKCLFFSAARLGRSEHCVCLLWRLKDVKHQKDLVIDKNGAFEFV